jgi:hypothetical protein
MATPAHERVLRRVEKTPDGCWLFQGAHTRGYGVVTVSRARGTAPTHRVVYEALVGPIPKGLSLDHLCAQPLCCNPDHLEPVTLAENTRRQWAAGRANAGIRMSERTHCVNGHEFTPENTRMQNGYRAVPCVQPRVEEMGEGRRRRRTGELFPIVCVICGKDAMAQNSVQRPVLQSHVRRQCSKPSTTRRRRSLLSTWTSLARESRRLSAQAGREPKLAADHVSHPAGHHAVLRRVRLRPDVTVARQLVPQRIDRILQRLRRLGSRVLSVNQLLIRIGVRAPESA